MAQATSSIDTKPTALVVIGYGGSSETNCDTVDFSMAGSGKTSLVRALSSYYKNKGIVQNLASSPELSRNPEGASTTVSKKCYVLNLDPAVKTLPYKPNIDICDSLKFKEVMQKYKLGPNGAITTSLNIFASRFDKVCDILNERGPRLNSIIVDTPGQIEVFNWSASGTIILDLLAVEFPTVILYVVDTPRCQNQVTFMSNMLHATAVLYKSRLPFILVFNKTGEVPSQEEAEEPSDISPADKCIKWTRDSEAFIEDREDDTYIASLTLHEFYSNMTVINFVCFRRASALQFVPVSAALNEGLEQLEEAVKSARNEYMK